MIGKITDELARLIAHDIYDAAKKVPKMLPEVTKVLSKSGKNLPEPLLRAFEAQFQSAMGSLATDGSGEWTFGNEADTLQRVLLDSVVRSKFMKDVNWAKATNQTAVGAAQVEACGGDKAFNRLIDAVVPRLVEVAINSGVGEFNGDRYGWRILTEVLDEDVAHRGQTDFKSYRVFYFEPFGTKSDTEKLYKKAKKTVDGLIAKGKEPSKGPFFK